VIIGEHMPEQVVPERITSNPEIFGGKPIIRGMRMSVENVLDMLAAGSTPAEILSEYPFLEAADIQACLESASGFRRPDYRPARARS
jgi:uncharacterized protein (DUF433 family)